MARVCDGKIARANPDHPCILGLLAEWNKLNFRGEYYKITLMSRFSTSPLHAEVLGEPEYPDLHCRCESRVWQNWRANCVKDSMRIHFIVFDI
jgi:hypothetical protein